MVPYSKAEQVKVVLDLVQVVLVPLVLPFFTVRDDTLLSPVTTRLKVLALPVMVIAPLPAPMV